MFKPKAIYFEKNIELGKWGVKAVEIRHALLFHALFRKLCRRPQLIQHSGFEVVIQHAGNQCQT